MAEGFRSCTEYSYIYYLRFTVCRYQWSEIIGSDNLVEGPRPWSKHVCDFVNHNFGKLQDRAWTLRTSYLEYARFALIVRTTYIIMVDCNRTTLYTD